MKITSSNWEWARRFSASLFLVMTASAIAADVQVLVTDREGKPVEGAIVWAEGGPRPKPNQTEILQENRQFHPEVTVVPVGSVVRFPNKDTVQHHVYSFSSAKKFDIPLYIGDAPEAVTFDAPGIVTLGCNIHDWMAAYIVVLDTTSHGITGKSGEVRIPATGKVFAWHPRLRGKPVPVGDTGRVTLALKPAFRRTPPTGEGGGYR